MNVMPKVILYLIRWCITEICVHRWRDWHQKLKTILILPTIYQSMMYWLFMVTSQRKRNPLILSTSQLAMETTWISRCIDCQDVWFVFRIDLPPSIWDLAQEMGQAGRGPFATGDNYNYFLFFSLPDLIYLFKWINDPKERCNGNDYRHVQCRELMDVARLLAKLRSVQYG